MKLRWAQVPLALAGLAVATPAAATPPVADPWLGSDKALHLTLSTMAASGAYGVSTYYTDGIAARVAFGAGFGIAVGAAKEFLDLTGFGDPSWKDFAWDMIGTALGVGISVTIDVATRRYRPVIVY